MAYFPKRLMPNIIKQNLPGFSGVSGASIILAEDFNRHTEEIIAIEEFLGFSSNGTINPAPESQVVDIINGTVTPANVFGVIKALIDSLNVFTDGGVQTSSGYIHSGQKMIFPEDEWATFLTASPAPTSTSISVASTIGFPESGVITILNDIDESASQTNTTLMEWIKYNGISSTSFLNCIRGYLGTTAGNHNGLPSLPNPSDSSNTNKMDLCTQIPSGYNLCTRRFPGWKAKTIYSFPSFGLVGTIIDIKKDVRSNPMSFDLSEGTLKDNYNQIILAATNSGIYNGSNLVSQDSTYRALNQLTWDEASSFIDALVVSGQVFLLKGPSDWIVGNTPFIPVFLGKMSISHSVASITLNSSALLPQTPVVTGPLTFSTNINTPFSIQITATNNPTSYAATGLPDGVSIDSTTGIIAGSVSIASSFTIQISATNSGGTGTNTLILGSFAPPSITSPSIASGTQGNTFSYQIVASNDPTSFNATNLPAGLGVDTTTGIVSGTLATAGTYSIQLSATNPIGTGTLPLTLTISLPVVPPSVTPPDLIPAITSPGTALIKKGTPFSYQITATNNPISFNVSQPGSTLTGSTLLSYYGLNFDSTTGLISGTPTVDGTFSTMIDGVSFYDNPISLVISALNAAGGGVQELDLVKTFLPQVYPNNIALTDKVSAGTSFAPAFVYQFQATNGPTNWVIAPNTGAVLPGSQIVGLGNGTVYFDPTTGTILDNSINFYTKKPGGGAVNTGLYQYSLTPYNANGAGPTITFTINFVSM